MVSKRRTTRLGRGSGGLPMGRGMLYGMLRNRLYRGEVVHKGVAHPGQHDAIVDQVLWDEVQRATASNRADREHGTTSTTPSLLTGLVHDGAGGRMSPSHANKRGTRYRYYVSQSLIQGSRAAAPTKACRVPAADLEGIVEARIRALLRDGPAIDAALGSSTASIAHRTALLNATAQLAGRWSTLPVTERRAVLQALVARVMVRPEAVDVEVWLAALPGLVAADSKTVGIPDAALAGQADAPVTLVSVPAVLKRTGQETRLLVQGATDTAGREPDRSLLRLLAQARRFGAMLIEGQGKPVGELAVETGVDRSHFMRVLRLNFLAPEITRAILQGRQPPGLTATKLKLIGAPAPAWSDQRRQLGFG